MPRNAITAQDAVAVGPYSHAIDSEGIVYFSGQTPVDSKTGKIVSVDIQEQTQQAFNNLFSVLKSAGLTPTHVIKVNVYLTDMDNFSAMNEIYKKQFTLPYPARTTIGVKALPLGALVEIEMIARRPPKTL